MLTSSLTRRFPRIAALMRRFRHPIAYLIVGGFAGLVHLLTGWALMHFANLDPTVASVIGFIVAHPFSYLGHKWITFRVPGRDMKEYARFVIGAVTGLILASLLPYLLVRGLDVPRLAALCVTVLAIPVINYLFMRFWVFAHGLRLKRER